MEKAAAGSAGDRWEKKPSRWHRTALAVTCCIAAAPLAAQELAQFAPGGAGGATPENPLRVELQATELPRLTSPDTGLNAPRLDFVLRRGERDGLGLAIGMSGFHERTVPAPGYAPLRTGMNVGLQWRHTLDNDDQIDISAWRRMAPTPDAYTMITMREPVYGARVELKLTPVTRAGFTLERGIGFQLESGAKISIKRRNGGPMLYYRTTF